MQEREEFTIEIHLPLSWGDAQRPEEVTCLKKVSLAIVCFQ